MSCRHSTVPMDGPLMLSDGPVWSTCLLLARPLCYMVMPTLMFMVDLPTRLGCLMQTHHFMYRTWWSILHLTWVLLDPPLLEGHLVISYILGNGFRSSSRVSWQQGTLGEEMEQMLTSGVPWQQGTLEEEAAWKTRSLAREDREELCLWREEKNRNSNPKSSAVYCLT
jgi:hypothetical protein